MEVKSFVNYIMIVVLLVSMYACSESYEPNIDEDAQQLVVEGFIEAGDDQALPAFVLLTRSVPFLDEIDQETFSSLFVREALVSINDGNKIVNLTEICLEDLPPSIRQETLDLLGLKEDEVLGFCVYIDLNDELEREVGKTYNLLIEVENKMIKATTTMPTNVPLRSFNWSPDPGGVFDSLARLRCSIDDPILEHNFYRYKTAANDRGLVAPFFSVIDDAVFNGDSFQFPLEKAEDFNLPVDLNTAGLFTRGDTVTIKWMTLDEAHFDFWNTLEFNRANQGPFASYTRVSSNVDGALGVFGAYTVNSYTLIVPN